MRTQGLEGRLQPRRVASEESSPADPQSQTSSLQDCGRINFCCLSCFVFGTLLGKLREANAENPTNFGGDRLGPWSYPGSWGPYPQR